RDPNPDFVLNRPEYRGAQILLAGENFGCGSSREHAVWALAEYGIRVVIAPSFAPIFYANCVRNGVVPVVLDEQAVKAISDFVEADPQRHRVTVDVGALQVTAAPGRVYRFALGTEEQQMLREGLDPIDLTMKWEREIDAFLAADRRARPWIYLAPER
ncbi:MAG: 3-isopropylmalate dehydratase small subunit, partial [Steroidobacteraceae bacterium]|nr:3-isopropylmalate dehydratase small subunit [Steroidobacteraceae bacterium]MDW8259711.1 3-isopropylmalate dehydratase small subunit [Gammaproteobacteria bacterium]